MIPADLVRHASLNYNPADDVFNGLLFFFVSPFYWGTVSLAWSCSGGSLALDNLCDSGGDGSMTRTRGHTNDMLCVHVVRCLPTSGLAVMTLV